MITSQIKLMYRFPLSFFIPFVFCAAQIISNSPKALSQSDSVQQGLIQAGKKCDRSLASILIDRGANPNFYSRTISPIILAIEEFNYTFHEIDEEKRQQCLNFINYLLETKADPNLLFTPSDDREFSNVAPSPLFKAIEVSSLIRSDSTESYTQVIETLLNNGANPNLRSLNKYDPNHVDHLAVNSTPLMLLMKESHNSYDYYQKIWDIMLPISDVNLQNNDGQTALMVLVEHSVNEVQVKRLLEAGARTDLKNAEGLTALDLAISQGKTDIVKLLIASEGQKFEKWKNNRYGKPRRS